MSFYCSSSFLRRRRSVISVLQETLEMLQARISAVGCGFFWLDRRRMSSNRYEPDFNMLLFRKLSIPRLRYGRLVTRALDTRLHAVQL